MGQPRKAWKVTLAPHRDDVLRTVLDSGSKPTSASPSPARDVTDFLVAPFSSPPAQMDVSPACRTTAGKTVHPRCDTAADVPSVWKFWLPLPQPLETQLREGSRAWTRRHL